MLRGKIGIGIPYSIFTHEKGSLKGYALSRKKGASKEAPHLYKQ